MPLQALLSSATLAAARWKASQADKTLPEEFLLEIDLEKLNLVETLPSNPLAFLGEAQSQVSTVEGVAGQHTCMGHMFHRCVLVAKWLDWLDGCHAVQLELARVVKALKEAGGCKVVHVPGIVLS